MEFGNKDLTTALECFDQAGPCYVVICRRSQGYLNGGRTTVSCANRSCSIKYVLALNVITNYVHRTVLEDFQNEAARYRYHYCY
jgi:hypothetical protein